MLLVKKKHSAWRLYLAVAGVLLMLSAFVVALIDFARFTKIPALYPSGMQISGIPVGGLSRVEVEERLNSSFLLPIELSYQGARMQFMPQEFGFQLNSAQVLDSFESIQGHHTAARRWWQHLWAHSTNDEALKIDLQPSADAASIRYLLEHEIAPRYDLPAYAPYPLLNSTYFAPGQAGRHIADLEKAVADIQAALFSPTARQVALKVEHTPVPPLDPKLLEIALKVLIQNEGFDGVVEIYTQDYANAEVMHFAQNNYQPVLPDIAYSAASTIKIPIAVSVLRHLHGALPNLADGWILQMLTKSLNPPADMLMKTYLDDSLGPLIVTQDMQELGFSNTFLAGFFADGSPLLQRFSTAANQRTDLNLNPDTYNQTVPSEIGELLARLYHCAVGNPSEKAFFNGELGREACAYLVDVMKNNRMGALIEAGLPPDQEIAHKHGWTSDTDGLLHSLSDVGIILDGDQSYVQVIFIHSPNQILFDTGSYLVARLSQSIYNSKHINDQTMWLGD